MRRARLGICVLTLGTALCLTAGPAVGKKKNRDAQELPETSRTVGGTADLAIAAGGLTGILDSSEAIGLCITLAVGEGQINVEMLASSALVIQRQVEPGDTETVCGTVDRVQLSCSASDDCRGRWRVDRR